jgi:hypothetical protein
MTVGFRAWWSFDVVISALGMTDENGEARRLCSTPIEPVRKGHLKCKISAQRGYIRSS